MILQHSPELEECAWAHEEAVIVADEYKVRELALADKDIKYIVDIGANLGAAAKQFQTHFPNAKIMVCEPEPELMKYAKINTDNKLIYIEEAIIGDNRKEVIFNQCKWAGNGHVDGNFRWDLFEPMGSMKVSEIKVKASTLTDIILRHEFPQIDLLKIDTEGMEGQILQSFKPYLNKVRHFRGEWHGDKDREVMKDALEDTHDMFIDKKHASHGDFFATLKEYAEKLKTVDDYPNYTVTKIPGLPDKIIMK